MMAMHAISTQAFANPQPQTQVTLTASWRQTLDGGSGQQKGRPSNLLWESVSKGGLEIYITVRPPMEVVSVDIPKIGTRSTCVPA
jgi:hypothetical protein